MTFCSPSDSTSLGRCFAAGDRFFPSDLALPAGKLQRHGRGSERLALLIEMRSKSRLRSWSLAILEVSVSERSSP